MSVSKSDPPPDSMGRWLIQAPREIILATLLALGGLVVEVAVLHFQVDAMSDDMERVELKLDQVIVARPQHAALAGR